MVFGKGIDGFGKGTALAVPLGPFKHRALAPEGTANFSLRFIAR
jgi:hypothetical protein